MIVDTGSSNIAVAGEPCHRCNVSPKYNESLATKQKLINVGYGSGSFKGVLLEADVKIGEIGPVRAHIASIHDHTNFFQPGCRNFQGILGLAYHKVSQAHAEPIMDVLLRNNTCDGFAIQICEPHKVTGNKTGNLWIGGYDSRFTTGPMVFTPIAHEAYYNVVLEGFRIGTEDFPYMGRYSEQHDTILDTGTTQILLRNKTYFDRITASLRRQQLIYFKYPEEVPEKFWTGDVCVSRKASGYRFNKNVQLSLQLGGGASLRLNYDNFFREIQCKNDFCACYSLGYDPGNVNILGEALMMDYLVFFDRGAKQIGFAPAIDSCGSELRYPCLFELN